MSSFKVIVLEESLIANFEAFRLAKMKKNEQTYKSREIIKLNYYYFKRNWGGGDVIEFELDYLHISGKENRITGVVLRKNGEMCNTS